MAYVTVRHMNDEDFRNISCMFNREEIIQYTKTAFKNNRYERVADLVLEGKLSNILEEAFRLTNSITFPWYQNADIQTNLKYNDGYRSTSIGDIIQVNGESYIVMPMGFEHIEG